MSFSSAECFSCANVWTGVVQIDAATMAIMKEACDAHPPTHRHVCTAIPRHPASQAARDENALKARRDIQGQSVSCSPLTADPPAIKPAMTPVDHYASARP